MIDFGLSDKVLARLLDRVGTRIDGILATTRQDIADEIEQGLAEGLGAAALGDRIEAATAFSELRAETIARTETATLLNQASAESYREYGVETVQIIDGDGDDECAAADGQEWTLDEWIANPIAHPNCVRDAAPILDHTPASASEEPAADWPEPDTSPKGIDDATSAWTGIHYADLREYQMSGTVREGMSLAEDPIHGISEERAAQAVSTLTRLIADGEAAPPLYRGLSVNDDVLAEFGNLSRGDKVDMALSSWSADAKEAVKFASRGFSDAPNPVVMEVLDAQGFDMSPFSFYPGEKEWITNGRFVVDSVKDTENGLVIRFKQEAVWQAPRRGVR